MVVFPPYRLDLDEERLWKGSKELTLRRKPFSILRYLVANPKRLVTHDELLKEVWGGNAVSESSVRSHLHELRQVLGEGVIETVIGRGYRFTAELETETPSPAIPSGASEQAIVGRTSELAALHGALERAHAGQRQLCFITGEPGIGKTTLIDAFLDELDDRADVVAVRGAAVEQHGMPEAYLPMMEVVSRLRQSRHGETVGATLLRHAPTFLAQIPHLVPDNKFDEITRRAIGGSEARMVRELNEAVEALASQMTLVIVLEDLQWSDVATLDLIGALGQRRERARLLVVATSRRTEAQTVSHPLNRVMRSLVARSGALAIPLEQFPRDMLAALIAMRFPQHAFPASFVDIVERITGGTPLFAVTLLADLAARGMVVERDGTWHLDVTLDVVAAHRPDSVKQLVDIQLDRLAVEEQRLLEAASIVGREFSTGLVAAALDQPIEQVDDVCDSLTRRALFLRREGTEEWPNGEQHTRYSLSHALVHEVCDQRGVPARRVRWHRLVAERLAAAYGARGSEIAHVLANHFDHGQVPAKAIEHYLVAAERTEARYATSDALAISRRARALLSRLPPDRARDQLELEILRHLAHAMVRIGPQGDDPLALFERMVVVARSLGDAPSLGVALVNLSYRYTTLARYRKALEVMGELDALASTSTTTMPAAVTSFGQTARTLPLIWLGELADAREQLDALIATADEPTMESGILAPTDRIARMISFRSLVQWVQGDLDGALTSAEQAHARAITATDPYLLGGALCNLARIHLLRGDPPERVHELAQHVLATSTHAPWHSQAALLLAWVEARRSSLSSVRVDEMMAAFRTRVATFPLGATFMALTVVDALRLGRHDAAARTVLDEMLAFIAEHEERVLEAEFRCVRGEMIEATDRAGAEQIYRDALALAEKQAAHQLALRAATRLARLTGGGRAELAAALARIAGGANTADVIAARSLLGE